MLNLPLVPCAREAYLKQIYEDDRTGLPTQEVPLFEGISRPLYAGSEEESSPFPDGVMNR